MPVRRLCTGGALFGGWYTPNWRGGDSDTDGSRALYRPIGGAPLEVAPRRKWEESSVVFGAALCGRVGSGVSSECDRQVAKGSMARLRFGRLTEAWRGEASDFTPLLREQLDALGAEIGVDLASIGKSEVPTAGAIVSTSWHRVRTVRSS